MSSPTTETDVVLHCVGLTKRYGDVVGLDGVDLTLIAGQTLTIVGPSGCGKIKSPMCCGADMSCAA